VAKEQGLYGAGQDLLKDSFSGNVKGLKDIAELAGMTRNALNVAKVRGKIDPGDLKSVVSFLFRTIIERQLSRDLFVPASRGNNKDEKENQERKEGYPNFGQKNQESCQA
jgi:hypothetical protein